MSESRAPELGINSWLEDELYQQYLNDRKTVDESWKEVFETNGAAAPGATDSKAGNGSHDAQAVALHRNEPAGQAAGRAPPSSLPTVPEHQPIAGETLMPLRGA